MKLRIRGNSLRLRLTRSEVEQLGRSGEVIETVDFGAGSPRFCYQLSAMDGGTVRAEFGDDRLHIFVPATEAARWIGSEQVGIEGMQPVGDGRFLRILVEKDFACLAERGGEDDSDAFPNPLGDGG